jgi:hypothetical protein
MKLRWKSHESRVKAGAFGPGQSASCNLFTARIRKNQGMLPPASTQVITDHIFRGIPFHVPEPIFRICCGWGGSADCTPSNFDHNGHYNDWRNEALAAPRSWISWNSRSFRRNDAPPLPAPLEEGILIDLSL